MQVGSQVTLKGYSTIFEIECYIDGWALLKRKIGDLYKITDWAHASDLTLV